MRYSSVPPPFPGGDGRDLLQLSRYLADSRRLFILTGAGCSTESGIPDYRDESGQWKRRRPMLISEFLRNPEGRRRYWARSFVGWPQVCGARPNLTHYCLARLESEQGLSGLVTQNVDGLHQKAGSRRVIDLHGRIDTVECLDCRRRIPRDLFQDRLGELNPDWSVPHSAFAPDGDADIAPEWEARFQLPGCARCGGILKPAVVFFGEGVPRERLERAYRALDAADAILVVGSSLAVWSGYRFVRRALERRIPVLIINRGWTRADEDAAVKVSGECGAILERIIERR